MVKNRENKLSGLYSAFSAKRRGWQKRVFSGNNWLKFWNLLFAMYLCSPVDGTAKTGLQKGPVAEWLGRALQKLLQRFESARDLTYIRKRRIRFFV